MQLSKRLAAIGKMVTKGNRLADIGTDHGYLPIYLIEQEIISYGIGLDIHPGPLLRAKEHIAKSGLESYIETRLSDGAQALQKEEVDTVVISGMGGGLTIKILEQGREIFETVKEIILQPQSEIALVRKYVQQAGYMFLEEDIVLEGGKFYPMMKLTKGKNERLNLLELAYGPILLKERHPVLKQYLQQEQRSMQKILVKLYDQYTDRSRLRQKEILESLKRNTKALEILGEV